MRKVFKSTDDAVRYGLTIQGKIRTILSLKIHREKLIEKYRKELAQNKITVTVFSKAAFQSQFLREAIEAAEGKWEIDYQGEIQYKKGVKV